jgi:Cu+-exporting ATPase
MQLVKSVSPLVAGILASLAMLAIYFAALGVASGLEFAVSQFEQYSYYVLALVAGFGVQIGLYVALRQLVARHHSRGMVVASGATSTGAMLACCTHYLANVAPVLGAAGLVTLAAQYQVQLFWVGLAFNFAGIAFIANRVRSAGATS